MLVYITLAILLISLSFPKDLSRFYNLMLFILFLFAALRGVNVDRDHLNYIDIISLSAADFYYPVEPAFKLISYFSINVFNSAFFLFFIFAALAVYFKGKLIKELSPYPMLSLLIYYSNTYLLHDMTQIRIGVAAAISFYGIVSYSRGNVKKFLCYIGIASMFHLSAMAFLICLIFDKNRVSAKFTISYIVLLFSSYLLYYTNVNLLNLLGSVNIPYFNEKYIVYSESVYAIDYVPINVFSSIQIIHILITMSFLLFYNRRFANHEAIIMIKVYSLAPVFLVLLSFIPAFSLRVSELFSSIEILLLPFLVVGIRQKILAKLLIVLVAVAMFYIHLFHVQILKEYSLYSFF